jgi:hypothetical protein
MGIFADPNGQTRIIPVVLSGSPGRAGIGLHRSVFLVDDESIRNRDLKNKINSFRQKTNCDERK